MKKPNQATSGTVSRRDQAGLERIARRVLDAGGSNDEILARLRESGAGPLDSMLVLNHVFGISLKESKPIVWGSSVWADLRPAHEQLEADLLGSVDEEPAT